MGRTQWMIGIAVGAGVVLAALALGGSLGADATTEPQPLRLGEPGTPLGEPLPREPDLPSDFVPDLPTVPTLPEGIHVAHAHAEGGGDGELGDDLSAEMRLLAEARLTLREDPAAALLLLDQHRERFPAGALGEERDAYTILALHALARTTDVERRYIDFRAHYAASAFIPILERALATP